MELLRRLLGISANSSAEAVDDIVITHGSDEDYLPEEPHIEPPTAQDIIESRAASAGDDDDDATAPLSPGSALSPDNALSSDSALSPDSDEPDTDSVTNVPASTAPLGDHPTPYGTRPLTEPETFVPESGQRIVFGQRSDVGMARINNQDACFSLLGSGDSAEGMSDFAFFVVADGMGGHQDGERASAITTRIVTKYVVEHIFAAVLNNTMNDPERPSISDVLRDAVQDANDAVTDEIPEGGTTVTSVVILGDMAYIAHVGDSRAYMIIDNVMEQVTRDHSLVQRLIELDQLTPEEAAKHPQRNVLYRAIGQSDTLDVDAITRRLPPRSRMMLCSDGLWNMVSEDVILSTITRSSSPQEACNRLVDLANDHGGPDNITVILIQMPG